MKNLCLRSAFPATLVLVILTAAPIVWASEPAAKNDYTPGRKLQRGLHNGVTGWMDAPITMQKFGRDHDWFETWTTGMARGVGLAFARTGAGIYETASSPFAAPENYEPVIMPERVDG